MLNGNKAPRRAVVGSATRALKEYADTASNSGAKAFAVIFAATLSNVWVTDRAWWVL